ncbi:hypothetical protein L596_001267 [Steinernema carpocapsae]|uniref:Uncharacterized protein n=1 Tax=Steinernema carpocapsae TaxID=34508 RepID=A0A4U8UL28_STECR|nr:hypothetical protein L596_001267 [Steinernema carpocapsae]
MWDNKIKTSGQRFNVHFSRQFGHCDPASSEASLSPAAYITFFSFFARSRPRADPLRATASASFIPALSLTASSSASTSLAGRADRTSCGLEIETYKSDGMLCCVPAGSLHRTLTILP